MKKIFSFLIALALALSFSLVAATPVAAATINVPSDYPTIETAVGNASDGDTITVSAGTYIHAGQIVIAKNLTIIGADRDTTIIKRGPSFSGSYFFRVNAGKFNLSNVTLDGDGNLYGGVRYGAPGTGTISNNIFKNIVSSGYTGFGVVAYSDNVSVSNSIFTNIGRVGIWVGANNALVTGNTYTGKGAIDCLDYGIEVGMGGVATITGNTIANCKGVASTDNSTSAGILVTTYYGGGTTATITGNTLTDNTGAIAVGYDGSDTSTVVAHYNDISGNTDYGIDTTAPVVDATANWWGDASGPYHATTNPSGTGDSVSDSVDYSPWWGANYIGVAHPWSWYTNDFIQEAVDDASAGDTVNVVAGNYSESIVIQKPLSLIGAGANVTSIDLSGNPAGGTVVAIKNLNGDVTFSGFTVKTGPASTVDSNGIQITNLTGGTITVSDNVIQCWQSASGTAEDNFGLIAGYFTSTTPKLVFTRNTVYGGGDNPVLIEKWAGPTEIINNYFNNTIKNDEASDVIFMMNYGGTTNNQKQLISGNTFDMGWGATYDNAHRGSGISVVGSYTGGNASGGFTNVETSYNSFVNLKPYRRGIVLWNNSDDGDGGNIANAIIKGNTISNAPSYTGQFGIRILGKATNTTITQNSISSGIDEDIRIQSWNGHNATGTAIHYNSLLGGIYGVNNLALEVVNATYNWWGAANGPYHATLNPDGAGSPVSDRVDFEPWALAEFPTVTTLAATSITINSATLNMNYTMGNYGSVDVRFAYKKSADSTWSYTSWVSESADGPYAKPLAGLASGTKYDFKAQLKYIDIVSGETVIDGATLQFTTVALPTVTTQAATEVGGLSATLNMNYTVGDFSPVQVRFAYKKFADSTWSFTSWVSKLVDGAHDAKTLGLLYPGTAYDFKAQLKYNETVIEGTTLRFTTAVISGCFIATAAYGTSTARQLDLLREFRDVVLLKSAVGSKFVSLYYQLSPPIADFIAGNGIVRTLVRELLIDPIVWLVDATGGSWRN